MSSDDESQDRVVSYLTDALPAPVKVIETHVSVIFLTGDRAYKLKKAVRFPFLDFTTLTARRDACKREVAINRRTAPAIYKGVVPVIDTGNGLDLGGAGEIVEWLVEMMRFDEETLFDRLAERDRGLRRPMMENLADRIWRFHDGADPVLDMGGHAGIRKIAENNQASFERLPGDVFGSDDGLEVGEHILAAIDDAKDVLEVRREHGLVRACHGDLHLRNICLIDGQPTLFDAIEFSHDFSDIDILYDLAFLLMDLEFRGHRRLAAFVQNRYLDIASPDDGVFRVLPIFLAMRAHIRAHVDAAVALAHDDPQVRGAEFARARDYLTLARTYLNPIPPRLIAVGGLSGSGKSRLAREIASHVGNPPGARVIRTDVVRKRLMGVHPNEGLGPEGYMPDVTERTYARFYDEACDALSSGQSVILDAVHAKSEQRQAGEALAKECGVPFQGIWVETTENNRLERVATRKNNVSDVTEDVVRQQSEYDLGDIDWARIDSSGEKQATIDHALAFL